MASTNGSLKHRDWNGRAAANGTRSVNVSATGFFLAGLGGAWLAHNLEYFRVWGSSAFPAAASRSVHVYMGPAGVVLTILALAAAQVTFRAAGRLERRLVRLRRAMAGVPAPVATEDLHGGGLHFTWSTLLGLLWLWQLVLYLVQENLEARALGIPLPGLGAISGVHALAPAVHLAVAIAVAGAVWLLRRRITHFTAEVRRVATMLVARRRAVVVPSARPITHWWTPTERWGAQLWGRPPPVPTLS